MKIVNDKASQRTPLDILRRISNVIRKNEHQQVRQKTANANEHIELQGTILGVRLSSSGDLAVLQLAN